MRRTWIKIYCDGWLRGSIRAEEYYVRSVFCDLLVMAGDSAYGQDGIIRLAEGVGFSDEAIAGILNYPLEIWLKAKEKLSNHEDPKENRIEIIQEKIGFSIKIINWKHYQSEYSRQKSYRQGYTGSYNGSYKESYRDGYKESNKVDIDIDIERDIEGDIEKEKDIEKENNKIINSNIAPTRKNFRSEPPPVFDFECQQWLNITEELKRAWKQAYPACDIDVELLRMREWILSNPVKGKKKNWRRFIINWLARTQEKGGTRGINIDSQRRFEAIKRFLGDEK